MVHLSSAASTDFDGIMEWTAEQFGRQQAETYAETLVNAISSLAEWPTTIGVKACCGLPEGFFTLHAGRAGRKSRHVIVFRAASHRFEEGVQVVRILHDSMDMVRHVVSEPH